MKKVLSLLLTLVMIFALVACASNSTDNTNDGDTSSAGNAGSEDSELPTYTFKLCDTQPEGSVLIEVANLFADNLAEMSDGRMTLEVYPSSQMGNATTCTQMLQTGDLTFFRQDAAAVYDFGVESHQVISLPYLFEDSESAYEIMKGEIGDRLKQDVEDAGLGFYTLGFIADTNRNFFTADTPVETMDDLKGLKIRSLEASIYVDYKSSLGLNPTPMAFSEVYTSLSTGVIDAAANTLDSFCSNKFEEVCKYYIMNNGMVPIYELLVSAEVYDSLSPEDQQIVNEAYTAAYDQYLPLARAKEAEQIEYCESKGVTFCYPTDEDKWAAACEWMFDTYGTGYEDIIDAIQNY